MDGENNGKPLLKWMIWGFSHYFWKHPYPFITLRRAILEGDAFDGSGVVFFRQGGKIMVVWRGVIYGLLSLLLGRDTPPKFNILEMMGLDDVSPFKYGYFGVSICIYILYFRGDTQKKLPCDQFPISEFCFHREKMPLVWFLTSMNFDHWLPCHTIDSAMPM